MSLRVGIIGCGRMGVNLREKPLKYIPDGWLPLSHAESVQSLEGMNLVALCDVDKERVQAAGAKYGVENLYTDYTAFIKEMNLDVLSIATRTDVKCEIMDVAIQHGIKGIHVEKPLGWNIDSCKKIIDKVVDRGVKITYGTYRRYSEVYQKAKQLIDAGNFGKVVDISIEHSKTLLMWNHPHAVDLLQYFSNEGEVEYIQANCAIDDNNIHGNTIDGDPILEHAYIRYKDGVQGTITSIPGLSTRISCTDAIVVIGGDGSYIEIRTGLMKDSPYFLESKTIRFHPSKSGTQRAFGELRDGVLNGTKGSIQPEDILQSQKILFGIAWSSLKGGIRISLDEIDEQFTVTGKYGGLYA